MASETTRPTRVIGGRYRLVAKLGEGGFGRVWRAHDTALDTEVAVKEVRLPAAMSDEQRDERLTRAHREARNAVRLRDNPNIVTVHDVVIDDGAPWIVMQLIDGTSLADHIAEHGPLSPENATKLARAMLNALGAAHAAGIVHRDVKPSNILLAADGRALLTDFGIAVHDADPTLTGNGFVGSPGYCAPERLTGADAGAAGDMFSLGATLFEAIEGSPAFRRDIPASVLSDDLPSFRHANAPLAALITKLLAKEPQQRPSVRDALALLDTPPTLAYEAPVATENIVKPKPAPSSAKAKPPAPSKVKAETKAKKPNQAAQVSVAVAGLVVVVAVVIGAFYFRSAYTAQAGDCVHKFAGSWYREPCGNTWQNTGNYKVALRVVDRADAVVCANRLPGWTYGDIPAVWPATSKNAAVTLCLEPYVK